MTRTQSSRRSLELPLIIEEKRGARPASLRRGTSELSDLHAVIIGGGPGSAQSALFNAHTAMSCLMADGRPMLDHMIEHLELGGIPRVTVILSETQADVEMLRQRAMAFSSETFEVAVLIDNGYKGTAGALKALKSLELKRDMLVIAGAVWLPSTYITAIARAHRQSSADGVMALEPIVTANATLENILRSDNGAIRGVEIKHTSIVNSVPMRAAGLYVLSPQVLDLLEGDGYADLKEQLVTWMDEHGMTMLPFELAEPPARITSTDTYFTLVRALMMGPDRSHDSVLTHATAMVHDKATVVGPVSIGAGAVIEEGAVIIGPAVIGDGAHIGKNSQLRECLIWENTSIGSHSKLDFTVVTRDASVPDNSIHRGVAIVQDEATHGVENLVTQPTDEILSLRLARNNRVRDLSKLQRKRAYSRMAKRTLDFVGTAIGLWLLSPLFIILAIAIKLDSKGPVFFVQRRCGKGGAEFPMIKFRTMCADADAKEGELFADKTGDGPCFKMENDPRITRVGRFLRRTCLDELPQLINVLHGEMSLVGPRPMKMSEMACSPRWRDLRLSVRPGMTGLWQVEGRETYSFEERIKGDIRYIQGWTFRLDLWILLRTVRTVMFNTVD